MAGTGTKLYIRKEIVKEASYAERLVEKDQRVAKKYLYLFYLKEKIINDMIAALSKHQDVTKLKNKCVSIIFLQHRLLKREEKAFNELHEDYRKIIDYDKALKDPSIHKAVAGAFILHSSKGKSLIDEMHALSGILTEQYNRLNTPGNYKNPFSELSRYFNQEKLILKQEVGLFKEEEKVLKKVAKAKPADMTATIEAILKSSTLVLWGNSHEFNTQAGYFKYAEGMQLRKVLEPGYKKKSMNEDEWHQWKAFTENFVLYPKRGAQNWKRGTWTSGFNFFVFGMRYSSDHVGRAGSFSIGVGYPQGYEQHMDQILNNDMHRKLLIQLLRKVFRL